LGEERNAAFVVGIPKGDLAVPETFALEGCDRLGEISKITDDERLDPEDDLRERCENEKGEQGAEARWR